MVFDKLLAKVINTDIKSNLSVNQHGGREHMSTTTAKIQMIYNMAKNGYDKILLIDLRKAFDLADYLSLKDSINRKGEDKINKKNTTKRTQHLRKNHNKSREPKKYIQPEESRKGLSSVPRCSSLT